MNKIDQNIQPLRMVVSPKTKGKKEQGEAMMGGFVIFSWVVM